MDFLGSAATHLATLKELEAALKEGEMPKDNSHQVTVDDEVHSIVTRYAAINNCSVNEALRRLVLNANVEDGEDYDAVAEQEEFGPF